jgi:nucleoid DNA-binding protein
MVVAKKPVAAMKASAKPVAKVAAKPVVKKSLAKTVATKTVVKPLTKKPVVKAPVKKPVAKVVAKPAVKPAAVKKVVATIKSVAKAAAPTTVSAKPSKMAALLTEPMPIRVTYNRTTLIEHVMDATQLDKKTVAHVINVLSNTMQGALMPKAVGEFTFPGLFKLFLRKVPARKAGVLVRNPGTGEMSPGKAKPASVRVKVRPLSKLRQAALA